MVKRIESESEAFEIIELAIDELDVLTRAFHLIQEVCNPNAPQPIEDADQKEIILN